MSETNYTDCV